MISHLMGGILADYYNPFSEGVGFNKRPSFLFYKILGKIVLPSNPHLS